MELAVQIEELISLLPSLPYRDLGFATNLINQFSRTGTLTPKSAPWPARLIASWPLIPLPPSPVTANSPAIACSAPCP